MKKFASRTLIWLLLVLLIFPFQACKKDEPSDVSPGISFDLQYVNADTSLPAGTLFPVKVHLSSNGGENLTQFYVSTNAVMVFNYSFNAQSLDTIINLNKDASNLQTFTFVVRNAVGLEAAKTIQVALNGLNYNTVIHLNNISLDGQSVVAGTSFYATGTGLSYTIDSAALHQADVDLLYYYNTIDFNCLASPGANVTGIYSGSNAPEIWTDRNTVLYSRIPLAVSVAEFDAMAHDSLIIANIFSDGGRKAKALQAGQVWALKLPDGRFGFVKINAVNGTEAGNIQFELKLQP